MNWSTKKASEVERLLSTDISTGLTSKIAALRLKEEGKNHLDRTHDVTLASSLKTLFFDVAHLPILCAIIMSFSYQSFLFGLLALSVWGIFMVLYTFFYWRAKHRIARAATMSIPPIRVLRDEKVSLLAPQLLVRGDVLFLSAGDTVPCDAYIVEADSLKVSESIAFAGGGQAQKNSQPTEAGERAYASMHNMLFATSRILSGTCKAICTATGHYTLAVRENRVSSLYGATTPDFFRQIKKKTRPFLYALTVFCAAILIFGFVHGENRVFNAFFISAAFISSMLPACIDGLLVIGYSLCLDALRHKKHARALLKNPLLPDLLPQLDCLFIDTKMMFDSGALSVQSIHTASHRYRTDEKEAMSDDGIDRLLAYASALDSCVIAEISGVESFSASTTPERVAMRRFLAEKQLTSANDLKVISYRPSGSGFYYDSVLLSDDKGGFIVSSGDAASILRSCTSYLNGDKNESLSESLRSKLIEDLSILRQQGRSTVAYAMARTSETHMAHSSLLHRNMTLLFFAVFQKRESGSLDRFFKNCAKRKIEPIIFHDGTVESAKLLIGDHPLLSQARICDGKNFPDSFSTYAELIDQYEIFASFSQDQKYALFRELIDRKFKVGVLTRNSADQPFLKDAHVVFLSASPSEFSLSLQNGSTKTLQDQTLTKESDVLVDQDINAISDSVEAMFDYRRNMRASFAYLTGMLALRILLCMGGALFGFSLVPMLGLLMLNFLWDAIIVYHLMTGALQKDAKPSAFIPDFQHATKRSLYFMLPFVALAVAFAVALPILSHYVLWFGQGAMALSVWWTLTSITLLYARFGFGIRFPKRIKTRIVPILASISLIGALPYVSTLFGVAFHWLSPIITILASALFVLFMAVSNERENKYKQ